MSPLSFLSLPTLVSLLYPYSFSAILIFIISLVSLVLLVSLVFLVSLASPVFVAHGEKLYITHDFAHGFAHNLLLKEAYIGTIYRRDI